MRTLESPENGKPKRPRAWFAGCMLIVFTTIGIVAAAAVVIDWFQGLQTYAWEPATCTVTNSDVAAQPDSTDYAFQVAYSFRWNNAPYTGDTFMRGYSGSNENRARVLASRYPVGTVVPCWVDPKDPDRSALIRDNLWRGLWIFVPLVFVAVGSGGLWLLRHQPLDGSVNEELRKAVRAEKGSPQKSRLLVGFFAIFLLFGIGFLIPIFLWPAFKVAKARSWSKVPCEILESGVRTHRGEDGDTYSVEVLFRYHVNERDYLSDRYDFLTGSSSGYDGKARIVAGIPPGAEAVCYFNPDDPHQAVLERGYSPEFLFGLIPLIFVLVGGGGIFFALASARVAKRAAAQPSWLQKQTVPVVRQAQGPLELEPALRPIGKLLLVTLIALFWNGIVSVFVWQLVKSWQAGNIDWFLALFLVPFVLIGLLLASGVPYSLLALANPRPRLRLSRGALMPGESAQVEWSFRGAAGRIRKLTIQLVAVKSRVGTQGTTTSSDLKPLTTVELVERKRDFGLEYGSATLAIPHDAGLLSKAEDETITWKLKLHGDIAYWPDVQEEYEITVLEPGGDLDDAVF